LLKRGIFGKPSATPQSLKSLGALPEVEATTSTKALNNVSKIEKVAETQSVKPVSKKSDIEYREVEIVNKKGSPIGEFDKIEKGLFVEEKSAKGLSNLHPRTGKPLQTPEQWARKQVYEKTVTRIENLQNEAVSTRATKNGSTEIPSLQEIKSFRKLEFRIEGDTTILRKAVEKELKELSRKYPNWEFTAEFGK
jgi:hypothetical protein